MPPDSDGEATVVCVGLRKVVPDEDHIQRLEDAVQRVHRITIDATELLTLHVTRCLAEGVALPPINADFVKMAMMEVSSGRGKRTRVDDDLAATRQRFMSTLAPVPRERLDQLLMAQSISLAASFRTNLWKHFPRRVAKYVRLHWSERLTERGIPPKQRALRVLQMAARLARGTQSTDTPSDDAEEDEWVAEHRARLGCDVFSTASAEKNAVRHEGAMLRATWLINRAFEDAGRPCISCCPTRRQMRPAFCNVDTKAIATLLGLQIPSGKGSFTSEAKHALWREVLCLDGAVHGLRHKVFACSMRTDGVSVRLLFERAPRAAHSKAAMTSFPRRGLHAIDACKHLSRLEEKVHLVGADPGKRELLVCVDDSSERRTVRYTAAQRREDLRVEAHLEEERRRRPQALTDALDGLSSFNSRSANVEKMHSYFELRRRVLPSALDFYSRRWHRKRLWERHVRGQRSITDFVRRISSLDDGRQLVIAYGSWGGVAGLPGAPCNRGHPPCMGKALRHKLSLHFVVLSTPEAYTSKTCSRCGSECGPCESVDAEHRARLLLAATTHQQIDAARRFSVRGLRHCHNERCGAHLNRDRNAARNIQVRCKQLLFGGNVPPWGDEDDVRLDSLRCWASSSD